MTFRLTMRKSLDVQSELKAAVNFCGEAFSNTRMTAVRVRRMKVCAGRNRAPSSLSVGRPFHLET
jgi:hypothetical protein